MTRVPESESPSNSSSVTSWIQSLLPIFRWLPSYEINWLGHDLLAGCALAAYAIPEALVNASLAGLSPQHGLYCFLMAGLAYALFTTSRHAAVAATSAVSIMVGSTLGSMGIDDPTRYAEMAACTAVLVGVISFLAWLLRLSDIVGFISETILSGFKVGTALVIASSQLPKILGIKEGGHNFFARMYHVLQNIGDTNLVVLAVGIGSLVLLLVGHKAISRGGTVPCGSGAVHRHDVTDEPVGTWSQSHRQYAGGISALWATRIDPLRRRGRYTRGVRVLLVGLHRRDFDDSYLCIEISLQN